MGSASCTSRMILGSSLFKPGALDELTPKTAVAASLAVILGKGAGRLASSMMWADPVEKW